MRRLSAALTVVALLAAMVTGCARPQPDDAAPAAVTLAPPTPAGMTELAPDAVTPPVDKDTCDRTASLRPFPDDKSAAAAVTNIRNRGRLIVGLDIGSNLFSFRDPITGVITGFDVDIAGEVSRNIFNTPDQVDYRILSSTDRITALQNNEVDIVVKTMTITCARRQLVNFSTVYLNAYQRILISGDSPITKPSDLSGRRVCVTKGTTSLKRIQQIRPAPVIVTVVTWADCLVAIQQHQVDAVSTDDTILAGLMAQDPHLRIVGPNMAEEPYGVGVNLHNTGLVRFVNGTLDRIRRDGTWNALYRKWLSVLGPTPAPPVARYADQAKR